jgi:hypothetical protein
MYREEYKTKKKKLFHVVLLISSYSSFFFFNVLSFPCWKKEGTRHECTDYYDVDVFLWHLLKELRRYSEIQWKFQSSNH